MIQIVITSHRIRARHYQESPCPGPAQFRFDVAGSFHSQKMGRACNQECVVMFVEDFFFYDLRIPVVTISKYGPTSSFVFTFSQSI